MIAVNSSLREWVRIIINHGKDLNTMDYTTIKQEVEKKYNDLSHECGLFWAFSNEQFQEGKTPLKEGEKYVSIGMGGYMPKGNIQQWINGGKQIEAWRKAEVKKAKADKVILYELNNYESFYTGDITDAMEVLSDLGYTEEQVKTVYHANREFAIN